MNKKDVASAVAEQAGIPRAEAERMLNSILEVITGSLNKGEKVTLSGFGAFEVSQTRAREGRNPRTGEKVQIPSKRKVKFKAGKKLSEILNR